MKKYHVDKGTTVYVQGRGTYVLQKDIALSYEVTKPLLQFPRYVLVARTNIKGSRSYKEQPTRIFVAGKDVWPEHPYHLLGVHEEDLHACERRNRKGHNKGKEQRKRKEN